VAHEPECNITLYPTSARRWECCCKAIRAAYRRGYNDHARSMAMWEATNGGAEVHVHYIQEGAVIHQCPPDGVYLMPCCNISPLERLQDRMSVDPANVTCTGRQA